MKINFILSSIVIFVLLAIFPILADNTVVNDTTMVKVYILKDCPVCLGHGVTICPKCLGEGKIKVNLSYTDNKKFVMEKCSKCGGAGVIGSCYYCRGTGKIKKDSTMAMKDIIKW